jgi:hypothetical protein
MMRFFVPGGTGDLCLYLVKVAIDPNGMDDFGQIEEDLLDSLFSPIFLVIQRCVPAAIMFYAWF